MSLFLGPSSKTPKTRKWPRAWLKARDGRALVSRVSRLRLSTLALACTPRTTARSLINKTTASHLHRTFVVHFFGVTARLRRKNVYFHVLWRKYWQATTKFFFLFVNFDIFPRDLAPVTFSYVSEIKWVGIISMEIERKRIHSATFSLPSPSSDLKVPILV